MKQGLIDRAYKLNDDTKGVARQRVFTKSELELMFNEIQDGDFNSFVKFAYYTGARSGEIRNIQPDNYTEL